MNSEKEKRARVITALENAGFQLTDKYFGVHRPFCTISAVFPRGELLPNLTNGLWYIKIKEP